MFKRIKSFIVVASIAAVLLPACNKDEVLDLRPEFATDALQNPSNMAQVEQVLLGAYSGFRSANYYGSGSGTGSGWGLMPDVLSDNLYETTESLANSRIIADFQYDAGRNEIGGFYQAPYAVIASANIVLRDVDKFTTADNQRTANRIKGQALAIRALAHFDLMRYFANSYGRNSSDLALHYAKEFLVSSETKPSRITVKEYWDNIFADLSQAQALLTNVDRPINPASSLTRPYLDLTGVYAIQARAYLYAGLYAEAITASTNAINARSLVVLNQTAFSGMYNQTNSGEIIWNVQFESGQSGPTFLVFFATNNRSYFRPALEVANTSGTGLLQSNDIRYNAYFTTIGGGLALTKYKGKGSVSDGNANFLVFRTGEMYLIRAEARARNNQDVAALDDLNTLRAARITGYVPVVLTGNALLDAIASERRRELIGEGHRFFDLKRTTRTLQRGSTCGNTTLSPTGTCSLAPNAREWNFPIPETVRNANTNLVQNPGY